MEAEKYLEQLKTCKTEQEFKNIWDPEKFNWKEYSYYLCKYCSDYFNIWWDSEKFNWWDSDHLCQYCSEYFDIWWDPNKFNWTDFLDNLCKYCSKYFKIWWNPKKVNWYRIIYIRKYCKKYKHIWEKDYIKWKLITI